MASRLHLRRHADALTQFDHDCIFVAPFAREANGDNAIPQVFTEVCGIVFGAMVDQTIVQTTKVCHTGADAMERLALRPEFDGSPSPRRITGDPGFVLSCASRNRRPGLIGCRSRSSLWHPPSSATAFPALRSSGAGGCEVEAPVPQCDHQSCPCQRCTAPRLASARCCSNILNLAVILQQKQ